MKYITRPLHALICIAASLVCLLGMLCFGLGAVMAWAADKVWPRATWGNCWVHAFRRWLKNGGYVQLRPSDGIRLLRVIPIPHAMWVHDLHPETGLEQVQPLNRGTAKWFPWFVLYFPLTLIRHEEKHESEWSRL